MQSRLAYLACLVFVVTASALLSARASAADLIYWVNTGANKVSFAHTDGSGGGDLNTTGAPIELPLGVTLDPAGGRAYWTAIDGIGSALLDGSGGGAALPVGDATFSLLPLGPAIDPVAKRIYWANFSGGIFLPPVISFAKLDGSGGGDLAITGATLAHPNGVAVDPAAKRIYWTNADGFVSFASLETGAGQDLDITGANHELPRGIAVDPAAGIVYWTNFTGNKISFVHLDGSGAGDLPIAAEALDHPLGLAIDHAGGRIYWTNVGDDNVPRAGAIFSANLNGSDAHEIKVPGATIADPVTPNLLVAPRSTDRPAITGQATTGSELSCSQGTWAGDVTPSFLFAAPQRFDFQWTRNGTDLRGATATTLAPTAGGNYACRVTATNRAGSTAATSAVLSVQDVTAPTLTKVILKPRRFANKAMLRFRASEPGRLTLKIAKGRKVKATLTRNVKIGQGKVRLGKRVGKRMLAPGPYRLTVTLRDAAGNVSKPVRRAFLLLAG